MVKTPTAEKLSLWYHDQRVGILSTSLDRSILCFEYSDEWLNSKESFEVSRQLPLERVVFEDAAQTYFSNLLPEGKFRKILARRIGVSEENDYAILEKFGEDCAGAFQISIKPPSGKDGAEYEMSLKDIQNTFETQASAPLEFLLRGQARLSLAGAQDKLAVVYRKTKIFLPRGKTPSTHIMKFPSKDLPGLVENEFEVLSLARALGLPVMNFDLVGKKEFRVLLIERYDRKIVQDQVQRIHQEDFCQALGTPPNQKYEEEGGPTFAACFGLVEERSKNLPEDLEILIRWLVFNVAVGNCDHHAKNLSFVIEDDGRWALSPIYDLLCTKFYRGISRRQAMAIGGSFDAGNLSIKNWRKLSEEIKYGLSSILRTIEDVCDQLEEAMNIRLSEVKKDLSIGRLRAELIASLIKQLQTQIRRTRISTRQS